MIFKILSSIVYCIVKNYVWVDYLCYLQTKLYVTITRQVFENRKYNVVLLIVIPKFIMNIISCNGFVNNMRSDIILSCRSKCFGYFP